MAKRIVYKFVGNKRKKRKGVHAKSKTSSHKSSINYLKLYKFTYYVKHNKF